MESLRQSRHCPKGQRTFYVYGTSLFPFGFDGYENILSQQHSVHPDFIEVLPGAMPKVIHRLCAEIKVPVIAGGLITDKESVMGALTAGATAVSSTNHKVWNL